MPITTLIIIFGSWLVILALVLLYFFKWSKRDGEDD